jgi:hypothetical protein
MKFQIRPPSGRGEGFIVNQEIVGTRSVTAEFKLNIEKGMNSSQLINKPLTLIVVWGGCCSETIH